MKRFKKNLYYEKFQKFKNETLEVINLQKKLIQSQLINFFIKNRNMEQQSILENNRAIKKLSKQLSNLIFISFNSNFSLFNCSVL